MICEHCGKEFKFTFKRYSKRFCSSECSRKHNKKRCCERKKFCVICGKELPSRRRSYCSDECRYKGILAFQRRRHEEEYKKPKAEEKPKKKRTKLKKGERLQDINALARAEGLTYGQYCAKHGLYY